MNKLKEYPLVGIEWIDAKDFTEESIEDLEKQGTIWQGCQRITFGRKVAEDKNGVILVTDIDEEGYCEGCFIPKTMLIREINDE